MTNSQLGNIHHGAGMETFENSDLKAKIKADLGIDAGDRDWCADFVMPPRALPAQILLPARVASPASFACGFGLLSLAHVTLVAATRIAGCHSRASSSRCAPTSRSSRTQSSSPMTSRCVG